MRLTEACGTAGHRGLAILHLAWALLLVSLLGAADVGATELAPGAGSMSRPGQPSRAASALDRRVESVAKALGLDLDQTLQMRQILANQREQVRQIWNDETLASAYRIAATQAQCRQAAP